jgi:DNA polymerase
MMNGKAGPRDILAWYLEAGVDEAIGEVAINRLQTATPAVREAPVSATPPAPPRRAPAVRPPEPPARPPAPARPTPSAAAALANPDAAAESARARAAAAGDLQALRQALAGLDECPLKWTAANLVFGEGVAEAEAMFIGEAPGADEDRQGLPFVGVSGQLLDRMMASIGLDRGNSYITNILPWRPPGNRTPTPAESLMLLPFIHRHIALVRPRLLVLLGGVSTATLLERREGITRLRGRWLEYRHAGAAIPAMPTYHPAFLLRNAAMKRDAWSDFLAVKLRLGAPG